ncbi:amidohydrolase family protein [Xanthomonas sacchari]|uniref:Amidohydrolase n=1 Tax=Xanthomonas sacchari TaxID=56458 RepID=A0A2P5Z1R5_9XANT|nr:amidohydrolase family protein [Xanthomonas sacchari]MDV0439235.1 amidohydrolase family protein [Xanthomonas sacchari]PPU81414.1 amidohydrolase [Xanthomonas sacchari]
MTIIDAHVHFWRLARGDYAWLTPDLGVLYRDYLPEDLAATLDTHGVTALVAVQAAQSEAETRYLLQLARTEPRIVGVVGWVDFDTADVAARIAALCADGAGLLKGLRPMVQDLADPQWLAQPQLDAAFDALLQHDLAFDALVRPLHLPALLARLQRHPHLRVVLDHAAKPAIGGADFRAWADGVVQLAQHPNVVCKLSGLLTELPADAALDTPLLAPYVAHLFACFGAQRLLWGSDWPVLTQRADYAAWMALAQAWVAQHAAGAAEAVFAGTARRVYRLSDPIASSPTWSPAP